MRSVDERPDRRRIIEGAPRPLTALQLSMREVHAALESAGKRLGHRETDTLVDFTAILLRKLDEGSLR
jgi:hypothetical protein